MIVAPPPPRPPLHFAAAPGWRTGAEHTARFHFSEAWTADVRFLDPATSDPPNRTLARLRGRHVVVTAILDDKGTPPATPDLDLGRSRHLACCEGATPGWPYTWEIDRNAPLILRVYFGARPTPALVARAQRALRRLVVRNR